MGAFLQVSLLFGFDYKDIENYFQYHLSSGKLLPILGRLSGISKNASGVEQFQGLELSKDKAPTAQTLVAFLYFFDLQTILVSHDMK